MWRLMRIGRPRCYRGQEGAVVSLAPPPPLSKVVLCKLPKAEDLQFFPDAFEAMAEE